MLSTNFSRLDLYVDKMPNNETNKSINKISNPKRIVVVFGCGGNRSRQRRFDCGEVSGRYADLSILTADNPRYEDPYDIILDMIQLLDSFNYEILVNRKKAIIKGIQMLKKGDILLILGKGHEDYQEIKGVKYPFSDKLIVLEYIWRVIMC